MPGMMDTVLNLGMNDEVAAGLAKLTKDERFVYDAYRRFVTMFADVVMGAERKEFDKVHEAWKEKEGVKSDPELSAKALKSVVAEQKKLYKKVVKSEFPEDPYEQLRLAIAAVFNSWNTPRAITYRKMESIPDDMGTACNIQTMVFGNLGDDSGSGVLFTRDPSSGEKKILGELLFNAQGEDVVAGIRTPIGLDDLKKQMPKIHKELVGHRREARDPLQGHAGRRVHHREGHPLHAAVPQREEDGEGGGEVRRRHGGGEAHRREGGDPPRRAEADRAAAPQDDRPEDG